MGGFWLDLTLLPIPMSFNPLTAFVCVFEVYDVRIGI